MRQDSTPEATWHPFVPQAVADSWGAPEVDGPGILNAFPVPLPDEQFLRVVERGFGWSTAVQETAKQVDDLDTLRALVRAGDGAWGSTEAHRLAIHSPHLPTEALTEWEFPESRRGFRAGARWLCWCSAVAPDLVFGSAAVNAHLSQYWDRLPVWTRAGFIDQAVRALLSDAPYYLPDRRDYSSFEHVLTLGCARRWSRRRIQKRLVKAVDHPRVHSETSDSLTLEQLQVIANILKLGRPRVLRRYHRLPWELYLLMPQEMRRHYRGEFFTLNLNPGLADADETASAQEMPAPMAGIRLLEGPLDPDFIDRLVDEVILRGRFSIDNRVIAKVGPQVLQIIQQRPDALTVFGSSRGFEEACALALGDRTALTEWRTALLSGPSIPEPIRCRAPIFGSDTWISFLVGALEPHLGDNVLAWNLAIGLLPEWEGSFADLVDTVLAATTQ